MSGFRDKIAGVIDDNYHHGCYVIADAIIAALPDMIPDLVWEVTITADGAECAAKSIVADGGEYTVSYSGRVKIDDKDDEATDVFLGPRISRSELEMSLQRCMDECEAHNRAQIIKAMGVGV